MTLLSFLTAAKSEMMFMNYEPQIKQDKRAKLPVVCDIKLIFLPLHNTSGDVILNSELRSAILKIRAEWRW